jgi:hypothetical protein
MRILFTLSLIFLSFNSEAQKSLSSECDTSQIKLDNTIKVFIKGKENDSTISRKFFRKPFSLTASNKEIKVLSFHMLWDNWYENLLVERQNEGNVVNPELIIDGINKGSEYSLAELPPGVWLYFDNITVKKGDTCYKAPPFIIYVKL